MINHTSLWRVTSRAIQFNLILIATLLTQLHAQDTVTPPLARPDIGIGLEGLADWSRAMMFVDAMKTSRAWGHAERPWEHTVKTDAYGWPLEDAGVVAIADVPNIGGMYLLDFDGKATVRVPGGRAEVRNLAYDAATKHSTAQVVVPDAATQIFLSFTGTEGGVRNVRLLRPGYPRGTKQTFTTPFLEKLKPFSTARFMDFQSTNNNPVKKWAERTTPAFASQARPQGGALEYVVELANTADKDIWVNVPDQADDEYIRRMATLLKDGLEPERKVYVEWSNEVWNWQFQQAQRNLQAARAEGKEPGSPLAFDKDTNEGYWAMRRIAKRSAEVGRIFRDVFGDEKMSRVRPVYATQVGYEEVYKQGLLFLENQYKQPNAVLYGIAGAPYFQISEELNKKKDLTVDEIFAAIPENMRQSLEWAATLGSYARYYNLKHLAYEGGQHLQDHINAGNADVKVQANRDPRMGQAIETYLRGWNALGGDLFMYFTLSGGYSKWGSWGLVEDITKSSPKYDAVLKVLNSPAATPTVGHAVPGTIAAGAFAATNRWDKKGIPVMQIEPGKWVQYLVRAPKDGTFPLHVAVEPGEPAEAQFTVNSRPSGTLSTGAGENSVVPVVLESGLNVIRISGRKGRLGLHSLTIATADAR